MPTFYNDSEPFVAEWLHNLAEAGRITKGIVDERSILDLQPADIVGERAHFFAGIGGWDLALQLAGWPADRPVWTGSCPCQPFSVAGKRRGVADERHLWPEWFRLIRECRPPVVFGEQVPAAIGHGWLDGVFADLEAEGYACGAVLAPAAGEGAPHIRERIFWVARLAYTNGGQSCDGDLQRSREQRQQPQDGVTDEGVAVAQPQLNQSREPRPRRRAEPPDGSGAVKLYGSAAPCGCWDFNAWHRKYGMQPGDRCANWTGGLGDSSEPRTQERISDRRIQREALVAQSGQASIGSGGFWSAFDLIPCGDGKSRRVVAGAQLLAHGISPDVAVLCPTGTFPQRTGLLRAFGNAIVPSLAAAFIRAFLDAECDLIEGRSPSVGGRV